MGIPSQHPDHEEEEEYDDAVFYEDIQAPKFVDLTAPDAGRPDDDPAWFCLRVGKWSTTSQLRKPFSILPSACILQALRRRRVLIRVVVRRL